MKKVCICALALTLLLCGGYLCMEARKTLRETPMIWMTQLLERENALRRQEMLPVRMLAVQNGTPYARVAAKLRPGAIYRIAYMDDDLRVTRQVWETELWKEMR